MLSCTIAGALVPGSQGGCDDGSERVGEYRAASIGKRRKWDNEKPEDGKVEIGVTVVGRGAELRTLGPKQGHKGTGEHTT